MATSGKRYTQRTSDDVIHRILDARTKALLNAVMREPQGAAVKAYLLAFGREADRRR
jgi:hypothetical protein